MVRLRPRRAHVPAYRAGLSAVGLLLCVGACAAPYPGNVGEDSTPPPPHLKPFQVAKLYPEYGPGETRTVLGGRLTVSGEFQVLIEGGQSEVPTRLDVSEDSHSVSVGAYAVVVDDSPRTAVSVPWFVPMDLERPWGRRSLVSRTSSTPLQVADCSSEPDHEWCS